MEKNFENNNENCLEFLTGARTCTITVTERKYINRIKKLYEERSEDFRYFFENEDGSVCASFPKKWFKVNAGAKPGSPKRTRTPEQIEAATKALAKWREKNKKKKNKGNDK